MVRRKDFRASVELEKSFSMVFSNPYHNGIDEVDEGLVVKKISASKLSSTYVSANIFLTETTDSAAVARNSSMGSCGIVVHMCWMSR